MTEDRRETRLIIYDGDCPVCGATAERLRRREWDAPHEVVAYQALEPDLAERMSEAGIDRQMLIFDPSSGETIGGFAAVQAIEAASGRGWFADLIALPGIAHLGSLGYRLFAVNRRLFSPVPPRVRCACDPQPAAWERWLAWLFVLTPVAVLAALTLGPSRTVFVAYCLLWMVPLLAAVLNEPGVGAIAGQLGVSLGTAALAGLLVWGMTGLWALLDPTAHPDRLLLSLAVMWLVGAWMLGRRFRTLGVPRLRWLWHGPVLLALAILLLSPRPAGS